LRPKALLAKWTASTPRGSADGFADTHIAALTRVVPTLTLAVKASALARMTGTLMETYLGRDAEPRVAQRPHPARGRDRIDAVIWFSDLRGFTRITDSAQAYLVHPAISLSSVDPFGDPLVAGPLRTG
jgi:adenylate cyclase